jgi:hypothetical protein
MYTHAINAWIYFGKLMATGWLHAYLATHYLGKHQPWVLDV